MIQFDETKLAKLHTADELLSSKYGEPGTDSRNNFEEKARAYYYGEILRDRRKAMKLTQQELADRVGTQRSYIARVEKGTTDIQLSSFLRILSALNVRLELKSETVEEIKAKAVYSFYNTHETAIPSLLSESSPEEIDAKIKAYRQGK